MATGTPNTEATSSTLSTIIWIHPRILRADPFGRVADTLSDTLSTRTFNADFQGRWQPGGMARLGDAFTQRLILG